MLLLNDGMTKKTDDIAQLCVKNFHSLKKMGAFYQ